MAQTPRTSGVFSLGALSADNAFEAPSLDLDFNGTASSFTRATTSPTAAKANGDQLATDIVTQNKSGSVQSKYMGPNGKLISGYRRNYAPHSTTFTSAAGWSGNLPSVTSGQADPFGGTDASVLLDNTNLYMFLEATQTFTSSNDYWCTSIFVKKNSGSTPAGQPDNSLHCLLRIIAGPQGANAGTYHDLTLNPNTGSFSASTSETGAIASVEDLGGWYRMSIAGKHSGNTTEATFQFFPDVGGAYVTGGTGYSASAQGSVIAFGAQFERGEAAAQSYRAAPDSGAQVPRVEYDASGNPLGLLVEESRTNLLYPSAFPTGASGVWSAPSQSTAAVNATGPDGTNSAATLTANPTVNGDVRWRSTVNQLTSTTYTLSFFAKAGTSPYVYARNLANSNVFVWWDVTDFSVSDAGANVTASGSVPVGNGWYRCYMTAPTAATIANNLVDIGIVYSSGSLSDANTATLTGIFYGAQLEQGEGPTSYIPTSGASAARPADDITLATSSFGFDKVYGTALVDATVTSKPSTGSVGLFQLGASPKRNLLTYLDTSFASVNSQFFETNYTTYQVTSGVTYPLDITVAQRRDDTTGGGAVNGALLSGTTIDAAVTDPTTLHLGTFPAGGNMNGHIRRFTYWPRAISDASLASYTTTTPPTIDIDRPMRRWGGITGRSLVAVPAFPAGSDFKISNGTVTGATYNGSGPTGSGYSSHWDTSSGSNYFSWTPSNASAPTAFTVIVDFETTDTTGAYKQIASFDVSHPNERASFHAYQTDIGWYDGSVKTFGLTYAANTRYVAIAVFNGSVITAYLVDTAAGTIVTSADITAAKGTSTVTPGYTTAWNTPSAIGRHNFYAAEYLSGQVYGGAYWPSALTEAQLVDAINHIRGQITLPTTGVLSLAEHYQSKL